MLEYLLVLQKMDCKLVQLWAIQMMDSLMELLVLM